MSTKDEAAAPASLGSEKKDETRQLENGVADEQPVGKSTTKSSRLRHHFYRLRWIYLLLFIGAIITMIVTLILCYVGMPAIAQSDLNDATLTLTSQVISDATPSSVRVQMNVTSHSKSIYHPQLSPFEVALFLEDTEPNIVPFGYLTVPHIHATAEANIVIDQEMEIANQEQFVRYNLLVLQSSEYRVAMRGRVGLKEMAFPKTTVNFNKVITSPGFAGFSDLKVQNITLSLAPAPDGSTMYGQINITNPTPIAISMGKVVQNITVGGVFIGTATIPDLTLTPGENLIDMSSAANQTLVLELLTLKYKTGVLPVTLVGDSSTVQGVSIPYFASALQQNQINTTLDLAPALQALGINITALGAPS